MKKAKKLVAFLLASLMAVGAMSGCSNTPESSSTGGESSTTEENSGKPDTSNAVNLVMYLIGDRPVDNDEVFAEINKTMNSEINATLEPKFMSWGEYEQKYPLVFASGEDWDIIFTADWCFYNAQATKQGFWEITEENLKKYAPMTAESMYEDAWEQAKVNGKVYMLPMNYMELTGNVYLARGDLMKKYGIESVSTLDEVEAYLDAIAKNEPSMIPLDVGSDYDCNFMFSIMWSNENWYTNERYGGIGPMYLMGSASEMAEDTEATVKGYYEQPTFLNVIKRLKDWKDRGFWSKNAAVNTQTNIDSFKGGKSALCISNLSTAVTTYGQVTEAHPEWDVQVFDAQSYDGQKIIPAMANSYTANGMAIFSKSKNPERALMALDYLRNDQGCNDLFTYGIEGKHWEPVGDTELKSLEASANYAYDGNCCWGVRDDRLFRTIDGGIPNYTDIRNNWMENSVVYKYQFFNFDESNVKNEVATISDLYATDYKLLRLGFTDDPESDIQKFADKMKAAGAEKVYEEMHNQALKYLESQSE